MAFVGHDAAELLGAASLGMATIAFNADADARADRHIERFEELLDVACSAMPCAAAG